MALDRGALAKIDRRVLAELDHDDGVQLVKVPLSEAGGSLSSGAPGPGRGVTPSRYAALWAADWA